MKSVVSVLPITMPRGEALNKLLELIFIPLTVRVEEVPSVKASLKILKDFKLSELILPLSAM